MESESHDSQIRPGFLDTPPVHLDDELGVVLDHPRMHLA
jgi:hypothetical protein